MVALSSLHRLKAIIIYTETCYRSGIYVVHESGGGGGGGGEYVTNVCTM